MRIRHAKVKKAPWTTGDIRCKGCAYYDPKTGMDDLGHCTLLNVYREPEEWCRRGKRKPAE